MAGFPGEHPAIRCSMQQRGPVEIQILVDNRPHEGVQRVGEFNAVFHLVLRANRDLRDLRGG